MPREEFHDKPYDAGTITKLEIFELYVKEWIPVFLSQVEPKFEELHIFDFFCGPGRDAVGANGSPLRILNQLQSYNKTGLAGWNKVTKNIHFFDYDTGKVEILNRLIQEKQLSIHDVAEDIQPLEFKAALKQYDSLLCNQRAAKLLIIDQFGVDAVSDEVFLKLISYPRTDFIFFLSSSTLHRFRNHPAIKQKIPDIGDPHHIHRATFQYYKSLIPVESEVFLGQFSIRKGPNVYGLIFGSQHPLGIHKFLQVAWKHDKIAGEANFDVDRENIQESELLLDLPELKPKKIQNFEAKLEKIIREKSLHNEAEVMRFCIESGMTCQQASPVISKLKKEHYIECIFRVPDVKRWREPRLITYT